MFIRASRYYSIETVDVKTRDGREVKGVKLRRLPAEKGDPVAVKSYDRLDILADRTYGNATMFWHIADANSELQAEDLVKEAGDIVEIPRQ